MGANVDKTVGCHYYNRLLKKSEAFVLKIFDITTYLTALTENFHIQTKKWGLHYVDNIKKVDPI